MLRASLGLLAGQAAVFLLGAASFEFLIFVTAVLVIVCYRVRCQRLVLAAALLGGVIAALAISDHEQHRWPGTEASRDATITGTVDGLPVRFEHRLAFFLTDVNASNGLIPRRVRLSWYRPIAMPQAGERWQFSVRLKPPAGLGNPGSFDVQRYSFIEHIDATGYVRQPGLAKRLTPAPWYSVDRFRQTLASKITAASSGQSVSLVLGLALGISDGIPESVWQVLRDTGTVHLLAISGLHIGLIATFAFLLAGLVWRGSRWLQSRCTCLAFALPAGFTVAAFYAALAGFSLPTQRALIMLAVAGIGIVARRASVASFALCSAALLIAVFDPTAVLSIGFTMSFAAVALLIYLSNGRAFDVNNSLWAKWSNVWRLQWQLSMFMLPLSAWFFSSGSLISPIANAFAIPLVGVLLVPLCIATSILVLFAPGVAQLTLQLSEVLLTWLIQTLQFLARLPASHLSLPLSHTVIILTAVLSVLCWIAPAGLRLRPWACTLVLPVALYLNQLPDAKLLEVHVLDVGQGLAVAVFTRERTLVFDTGGRLGNSTMMERVVMPFLATRRREHIDLVVVSHADEDHSAGLDFIESMSAAPEVIASERTSAEQQLCRAGMRWHWDGVEFAFVHPGKDDSGSRNNRSCVLLIFAGNSRFLLTGDIEKAAEQTLLERGFQLPVTVMTAPHHGSASSSSMAFLQALQPEHVVIPAGRGNRYGLPDAVIVKRYRSINSQVWLTSEQGAVSFIVGADKQLKTVRSHWRRGDRPWQTH